MEAFMAGIGFVYILSIIGMGIVQPISGIIRLLNVDRYNSTYAIGLKRYLMTVVAYFLMLPIIGEYFISEVYSFYLFGVSMMIGIGYMRHIWKWREKHARIKAYDAIQLLNVPCKERLELEQLPAKKVKLIKLKNKLKVEPILQQRVHKELILN